MQYREYGNTGKSISVLGVGGMRFINPSSEKEQERYAEILIKANDNGINYFDTAHEYCAGYTDLIFAKAFQRMKNPYYVSAKSRIEYDPDEKSVRKRIEYYLKTLGVDKVHFFHMWCILNLGQYYAIMKKGGPYEGAVRARQEGLIDHICFSTHCSGDDIVKIIDDGCYEGVTLGYNILNFKYRENAVIEANRKGMGVAVMNPLAGGIIPQYYKSFPEFAAGQKEAVEKALGFVVAHDEITVALSGMVDESEIMQNINIANKYSVENAAFLSTVKKQISKNFDNLCTGCQYCLGCPSGIETNKLMQSYNLKILSGNMGAVLTDMKDKWFYSDTINCVKCGLCEEKCTQHLKIRDRIQEINREIEQTKSQKRLHLQNTIGGVPLNRVGLYGIGGVAGEFVKNYELYIGEWTEYPRLYDKNKARWGTKPFRFEQRIDSPEQIIGNVDRIIICNKDHFAEIYNELKYLETEGITIVRYS